MWLGSVLITFCDTRGSKEIVRTTQGMRIIIIEKIVLLYSCYKTSCGTRCFRSSRALLQLRKLEPTGAMSAHTF